MTSGDIAYGAGYVAKVAVPRTDGAGYCNDIETFSVYGLSRGEVRQLLWLKDERLSTNAYSSSYDVERVAKRLARIFNKPETFSGGWPQISEGEYPLLSKAGVVSSFPTEVKEVLEVKVFHLASDVILKNVTEHFINTTKDDEYVK
jgi:hypothetical protein